jgi:hypothetical protein
MTDQVDLTVTPRDTRLTVRQRALNFINTVPFLGYITDANGDYFTDANGDYIAAKDPDAKAPTYTVRVRDTRLTRKDREGA